MKDFVLGPSSKTREVGLKEVSHTEAQPEVSVESEEQEVSDHGEVLEVEAAPMGLGESPGVIPAVRLTTKPEIVLGSSEGEYSDIGTLKDTLIVKNNDLSNLDNDDIFCSRLADLQLSILKAGYRVPANGLHSIEARNFYKNILHAPSSVLNILEQGYDPPVVNNLPQSFYKDNNKSARENLPFVRKKGFFFKVGNLLVFSLRDS